MALLCKISPCIHQTNQWKKCYAIEKLYRNKEVEQPLLSISHSRGLEYQIEDNILYQFIFATTRVDFPHSFSKFDFSSHKNFKRIIDLVNISTSVVLFVDEKMEALTVPIEVSPQKYLIINS